MILLRNFDIANQYFDYESKTQIEDDTNPKIRGWYKYIDGLLTALFVEDNNLYFLNNNDKFLINDNHKVSLSGHSQFDKKFSLLDNGEEVVRFLYPLPDPELSVSPFEYIDEEDLMWGEFIEKVINNSERKRNFCSE
jgi:hypothetical protein